MPNEMVERVSAAMQAAIDARDFYEPSDDEWRIAARAALGALLNPNGKMLMAGRYAQTDVEQGDNVMLISYQAMLRAALEEE